MHRFLYLLGKPILKMDTMKKMIMLAAAAIMFAGASKAQVTETFPSYLQVNGKAELEIEPNEIYVKITIDESDTKGRVSVAEQERKMIAALKKLGINTDKDLKVGDMAGELQSYVLRKDKVQTSKTYILKVGDAATLGKVFKELADINISNMKLSKVTRSDLPELRMKLRAEAMKDAKKNAETLAGAIGQKAGKAFNITDYNSFSGGEVMYDTSYRMMSKSATTEAAQYVEDDALVFQNLKLSYSVSARFVLE